MTLTAAPTIELQSIPLSALCLTGGVCVSITLEVVHCGHPMCHESPCLIVAAHSV